MLKAAIVFQATESVKWMLIAKRDGPAALVVVCLHAVMQVTVRFLLQCAMEGLVTFSNVLQMKIAGTPTALMVNAKSVDQIIIAPLGKFVEITSVALDVETTVIA